MGISLYRKYRPQNFASVVGQKSAVEVITNSIAKGRAGHAYLFSGSRGCGKTSIARIFAKALNCLEPEGFEPCGKCRNCEAITAGESLDVIEIDGASNNGVENIRGLKENVTLAPFSSKYKVYIIDEVHMLSQGAFNALLKTLEEPPEYVVFILATTEPHKVPVTIRSRCQHIPFHSITPEDIFSRLEYVCAQEAVEAEQEALWEIARQADGALRDALSLLEQVIASGEVTLQNVEAVFGAGSRPAFERWVKTLRENPEEAYTALKAMFDGGASGVRVFEEMFSLVRNLWLASKWKNIADSLGLSGNEKKFLLEEVRNWKTERLHTLLAVIMKLLTHARQGIRPDILLGMFMLYLEPVPEVKDSAAPAPVTSRSAVTRPAPAPVIAAATPYAGDDGLKAELLETAHGKDFALFCALLDSRPRTIEDRLILNMEHAYCFDFLKRRDEALTSMFSNYSAVFLQHGNEKYMCLKTSPKPSAAMTAPASKPIPTPEPTLPVFAESEPKPEPKASSRHELSPFDELKRKLTQFGARPEILYVKNLEPQEDSGNDDTEITEGENES